MSRDHRNIHASVGVSGDPLSTNNWSPEWPRALFARNTVCRITRCMTPERVKHRSQGSASGNYRRTSVLACLIVCSGCMHAGILLAVVTTTAAQCSVLSLQRSRTDAPLLHINVYECATT
ncbi:hypothetical protein CBL_10538 [Carabus blaptoides fortunei]